MGIDKIDCMYFFSLFLSQIRYPINSATDPKSKIVKGIKRKNASAITK